MKIQEYKGYNLYLDDLRTPKNDIWLVVRDYNSFINIVETYGLPELVSFDHDLGESTKTGYDCAKWLCDYCFTNGLPVPNWDVHSANPVGRDNINFVMNNHKKRLN